MQDTEIEFYTTSDVRRILGIGNKTCLDLFHRSDFPCVKIGKSFKITKENFMNGYNAIEKPKTKVIKVVPRKIALTLENEKRLIDYLEKTPIYNCKHKNLSFK